MKREEIRHILGFVLLVLVCGSGCITPRMWGPTHNDLAWIGLDEHTRARLDGAIDPRPNDPEPGSGLYGKLLIYPFTHHVPSNYASPKAKTHSPDQGDPIQFQGIEEVRTLTIFWEEDRTFSQFEDRRRMSATEYKQALFDVAKQEGADLLLVYVVKDRDTDDFDVTFTIAPILTLGLAPTTFISAEINIEGALIDAKTGYIYAVLSSEGDGLEITNLWNRYPNTVEAESDALREASQKLIEQLQDAWPMIQQAYP